uniref:Tetracyclin repressor-like C-terminal domain-containing protein n=2 Tax=Chryseobacterium TaxID=59732 RepID=A0AAU6WRW6_9FLAO
MAKISEVITQGQENGELNEKPDAEEYASLFVMNIEGGILLSKTTGDEKFLHLALDHILKIIDTELATTSPEK